MKSMINGIAFKSPNYLFQTLILAMTLALPSVAFAQGLIQKIPVLAKADWSANLDASLSTDQLYLLKIVTQELQKAAPHRENGLTILKAKLRKQEGQDVLFISARDEIYRAPPSKYPKNRDLARAYSAFFSLVCPLIVRMRQIEELYPEAPLVVDRIVIQGDVYVHYSSSNGVLLNLDVCRKFNSQQYARTLISDWKKIQSMTGWKWAR